MGDRTKEGTSQHDNEPKNLKLEKTDDLAEGELETVEESLKQHEKKDKQKEQKQ